MGDANSLASPARSQAAGEMAPAIHDKKAKEPGRTTSQDKPPLMESAGPANEGAGQGKEGLMTGHSSDIKHLEFYGENIPTRRNVKTEKVYKNLYKTFGSVDNAVRYQHGLLGLGGGDTGQITIKEDSIKQEDIIKREED